MTYTASKAQAGRGSVFSIGGTPTEIGEVTDISFNRPEWDFVDVTNLDSGSDQEMLPTIRKATTFTVKGNRVAADAGQTAVETAYASAALAAFTLLLPKTATQTVSGDKYTFSAYVKNAAFDVAPTKQIEYNISLQTSGAVTYTAGS
jgi:predicted secreted protein